MALYYYHQEMRVSTDADLRRPDRLQALMQYLAKPTSLGLPSEHQMWELWVSAIPSSKYPGGNPRFHWVNHELRVITREFPRSFAVYANDNITSREDSKCPSFFGIGLIINVRLSPELNMECQYWSYAQ